MFSYDKIYGYIFKKEIKLTYTPNVGLPVVKTLPLMTLQSLFCFYEMFLRFANFFHLLS